MADAFLLLLCVFVPLAFPHAFVSGDSTGNTHPTPPAIMDVAGGTACY